MSNGHCPTDRITKMSGDMAGQPWHYIDKLSMAAYSAAKALMTVEQRGPSIALQRPLCASTDPLLYRVTLSHDGYGPRSLNGSFQAR